MPIYLCVFAAVSVHNATIQQHLGFFKPDPYVELCVDGQTPPRKTEVISKSLSPTWNEHFTVYVVTCLLIVASAESGTCPSFLRSSSVPSRLLMKL